MARRKLEAPSAADLEQLETQFRRETPAKSAMAPIAQVAGEAAAGAPVLDPETRANQARDAADAQAHRDAVQSGALMQDIPISQIVTDGITRDRITVSEPEMEELCKSILRNGLRLPIEVYELAEKHGDERFGLMSGYRRLMAIRRLYAQTGLEKFSVIRAIERTPGDISEALTAMVEENEIRSDLCHFERGRIAAISAHNGFFTNVEEAVDALFYAASKAKRSKVRSFAQVFEDLGDLLSFPEALTERQGLRLAAALRAGAESELRAALGSGQVSDADAEWALLDSVILETEGQPRDRSRGGRPSTRARPKGPGVVRTSSGVTLRRVSDGKGYMIRIEGPQVDGDMVDTLMAELQRLLEP